MERHEVVLPVHGVFRLDIGGLGSAGYAWSHDTRGEPGVLAVALEAQSAPATATPGGLPPDSSSVRYVLVLTAQAPGEATVHVTLRRPWERQKPPLREVAVHVTVSGGR